MIPIFNSMTGFTRKFQYPNVSETLATEWGGVNNCRMFVSDQGSISPGASMNSADIANNFICAKEAYKVVWQAGGKMKFIYFLLDITMIQRCLDIQQRVIFTKVSASTK